MGSIKKQLSALNVTVNGVSLALSLDTVEGVAPVPEIVSVPRNQSRVFVGLAYILGQIMAVVDMGPLLNAGKTNPARDSVICLVNGEYYAFLVSSVGSIMTKPKAAKPRTTFDGIVTSSLTHNKSSAMLLDVQQIISRFVCS